MNVGAVTSFSSFRSSDLTVHLKFSHLRLFGERVDCHALAYSNLGINVSYGEFDAKRLCSRGRSNRRSVEAQLLLPFAIESLKQENIEFELVEKNWHYY
jgi:hypothetical protein